MQLSSAQSHLYCLYNVLQCVTYPNLTLNADEYGVGAAQSTSRVIARHAAVLRRLLSHAPPPQPACVAALQQERVRAAAEAADKP